MSKISEFLLRLYFTIVAVVTLFMLIFGGIDLLSIGLKTYVFKAADVPEHIEQCETAVERPVPDGQTKQEALEACEARKANAVENYNRSKARDAVRDLAITIVSLPLFILHFRTMIKDRRRKTKSKKKEK